ncbi:LAFA_0G24080g1_1 [Lachancea sp. 'fantastica']|nr:LAFA_0G24080g1_1 [Lachancea sp. 'fantastica']
MNSKNVESMLDELLALLNVNYRHSNELVDNLTVLIENSVDDAAMGEAFTAMRSVFGEFIMSMANLRDEHTNVIESYNTKLKLGPSADVAKSRLSASVDEDGNESELLQLVYEVCDSYNLHMEHINLVGRLSSKLCDPALASDRAIKHQDEDLDLEQILKAYDSVGAENLEETADLKRQLLRWTDAMKMEKARFTLENQHILRDKLKSMTAEVTQWKNNYESVEDTMFGDDAHSITQTIQRIQKLRPQLEAVNREEDIEMN